MKQSNIKIGENDIKASDIIALNHLLKQLNPEAASVNLNKVKKVMEIGIIITLRDSYKDNVLIGMGTLIPIQKLFSYCGTIEDIVVDKAYRRQGLGKKIMNELIKKGGILGMKFIDLTSNPKRLEANSLYWSIGFQKRDTNVYRLYL